MNSFMQGLGLGLLKLQGKLTCVCGGRFINSLHCSQPPDTNPIERIDWLRRQLAKHLLSTTV